MELFPRRYDMICELTRFEDMMPEYKDTLRKLGRVIRKSIWRKSNEDTLAYVMYVCNNFFEIIIESIGAHIDFADEYVVCLEKQKQRFSINNLDGEFGQMHSIVNIERTQELMKEHWAQINPYLSKEYSEEDFFTKNIINLCDDVLENIISVCPEDFFVDESSLVGLYRGRRKMWTKQEDLMPASIEDAKKNNIINRWNPPDKRYLYMSLDNDATNGIITCMEELRMKEGEMATFAEFEVNKTLSGKLLNLDYESISREQIMEYLAVEEKKQRETIIDNLLAKFNRPSPDDIKKEIAKHEDKVRKISATFCGKLFFKEMCDAIFVPLDENEDSDDEEKMKCYKAFHIFAEYLENKKMVGIIYPSTRMKLINKIGKNVVLFNPDDATPILSSFKFMQKEV